VLAATIAAAMGQTIAAATFCSHKTGGAGVVGDLWTRDTARAQRIARRLETGGLFINGFNASNPRIPVGGVKKSGYGRELSHFGCGN
jgi:acyl-CoA reductase-like NAD-dependent aldehyde dehydrogenase